MATNGRVIAPDTPPAGFYVYLLVDPRDGRSFYVGKGQGWRAWQHEKDVRSGRAVSNRAKIEKIRSIIEDGLSPIIAIAGVFDLESDALNREFKIVDASPSLLNAVPGGQAQGLSRIAFERLRKARHLRLQRLRDQERRAAAFAQMRAKRDAFLRAARSDAERVQIEGWLNALSGPIAERTILPKLSAILIDDEARAKKEAQAALRKSPKPKSKKKSKLFCRRGITKNSMRPSNNFIQ